MKELEDWLIADPRRTAIICRAKLDGVPKWFCCLHDVARWQLPWKEWPIDALHKETSVQLIAYEDTYEGAILAAIRH